MWAWPDAQRLDAQGSSSRALSSRARRAQGTLQAYACIQAPELHLHRAPRRRRRILSAARQMKRRLEDHDDWYTTATRPLSATGPRGRGASITPQIAP